MEIVEEFLESYESQIIQMAITYRMDHGLGALFVTLEPGKDDLDVSYYRYQDLMPDIRQKMSENKNINNTIYYVIIVGEESFLHEKELK